MTDSPARSVPRWRRILGTIVVVLGVLLAPVALVSTWAVDEFTDTDRFVETFGPLASDPGVQRVVAAEVTTLITEQVDVPALTAPLFEGLGETLPPVAGLALGPLEGLVNSGITQLIGGTVDRVVESEAFATVWESALRTSHAQLVGALEGDPNTALTIGEEGTLGISLGPIVSSVQTALVDSGVTIAAAIPDVDRTIVLVKSDSIASVQAAYRLAHAVAAWLPWLVVALIVGGVVLLGAGIRSIIGSAAGIALVMGLLIVGLAIGRAFVIDTVASTDLPVDVAQTLFHQLLGRVYTGAVTFAIIGLVIAATAWAIGRYDVIARVRARFAESS
jgi:hypothetical protein